MDPCEEHAASASGMPQSQHELDAGAPSRSEQPAADTSPSDMAHRTTHAAMRAVLETTELLESILEALPSRDTVVSMRVCKSWNKCVRASPSLQKHLFMVSEGLHVRQILYTKAQFPEYGSKVEPATMFSNKASVGNDSKPLSDFWYGDQAILTPVRLSPLTTDMIPNPTIEERFRYGFYEMLNIPVGDYGPWSDMLLCDPPLIAGDVLATFRHSPCSEFEVEVHCKLSNPSGLTIRDVHAQMHTVVGDVDCRLPRQWVDPDKDHKNGIREWMEVRAGDVMAEITDRYGGELQLESVVMFTGGALVVNEEEWALVECKKS